MSAGKGQKVRALAGGIAGAAAMTMMMGIGVSSAEPVPSEQASSDPAAAGSDSQEEAPSAIPPERRREVLGRTWNRSTDLAWTLAGDASGLHVLTAEANDGYAWQTIATLAEPGLATDRWIGNGCATASGERLVVTYAPRSFSNQEELSDRGAFTAVIDLATGEVRRVPVLSSLAYFTPSCGFGEQALLTVSGGAEIGATRLVTVDTITGLPSEPVEVGGQLTSAILTDEGIVAAAGTSVVKVDPSGVVEQVAETTSTPYDLTRDSSGGIVYLDYDDERAAAHHLDQGVIRTPDLARAAPAFVVGDVDEVNITASVDGAVLITGDAETVGDVPATVTVTDAPSGAVATMQGEATITVQSVEATGTPISTTQVDPTLPSAFVDLTLQGVATGRSAELSVRTSTADPSTAAGGVPTARDEAATPSSGSATVGVAPLAAAAASGDPANPVEDERSCAVPMNDPANQAMQPKPRQVEWAVNQAVNGALMVQRPANFKGWGMPAYKPQVLFPPIPLSGGGQVPSQILLGIFAQESNLWMTPGYAAPGLTANPLVGRYWGQDFNAATGDERWAIRWDKADCGYGIGQLTDGMRLPGRERTDEWTGLKIETALPYDKQRAIALDFAANTAASLQLLQQKWNQTLAGGLTINDGNPSRIENWFYAVWAYNSGFYPEAAKNHPDGRNGAWGVGWVNNPANPNYDPKRGSFGERASDFSRPQDWPYPERVLGFAANPPSLLESPGVDVPAYRAATWNGTSETAPKNRTNVKPPLDAFCTSANDCVMGTTNFAPGGYNWGPCQHRDAAGSKDGRCWVNGNTTWKANCDLDCGRPFLRFSVGYAYQEDGTSYPPNCSLAGLPPNALVIDDIPDSAPDPRCAPPTTNAGTFRFAFAGLPDGSRPSKADLHQLGSGYGGHFWFGHTRAKNVRDGSMKITGTWTLDRTLDQWTRILVHVPSLGAHTRQATYKIFLGDGTVKERTILQRTMKNGWVSLGVFQVNGTPSVQLSTETLDGDFEGTNGEVANPKNEDIAFDAIAFEPLAQKPANIVVALGDSYSSGEGGTVKNASTYSYYQETDFYGNSALANTCHRSPYTWSRVAFLPDAPTQSIGARADNLDTSLDYHLLACSGAVVRNVIPDGVTDGEGEPSEGKHGELAQLDQGFVDENTTLVTISIGGNDAKFGPIVTKCVTLPLCELVTLGSEGHISGPVEDSVVIALEEIRKKAPNARVMLMGYPPLLSGDPGECVPGIDVEETNLLNFYATHLQKHLREAKDRANDAAGTNYVTVMDPRDEFEDRGICGSPEAVHGIIAKASPGEPPLKIVSQQSFHPNIEGYELYANVLTRALR